MSDFRHPTVEAVEAIQTEVLAAHGVGIGGQSRELLEAAVAALSGNGLLKNQSLDIDARETLTLAVAADALERPEVRERLRALQKGGAGPS